MNKELSVKNVLILASQVPFSSGGAEVLIGDLVKEIRERGHNVDVLSLPFLIKNNQDLLLQISQWRQLDLSEVGGRRVDLVIATKFPTYFANHPNKIVWMIHQHRQAYDLYGTRYGDFDTDVGDEAVRQAILNADRTALGESKKVFTILYKTKPITAVGKKATAILFQICLFAINVFQYKKITDKMAPS